MPAPEIELAVAVEIQAGHPARDQRFAGDVVVAFAGRDVLEGAAARVAGVVRASKTIGKHRAAIHQGDRGLDSAGIEITITNCATAAANITIR